MEIKGYHYVQVTFIKHISVGFSFYCDLPVNWVLVFFHGLWSISAIVRETATSPHLLVLVYTEVKENHSD